MNGLRTSKTNFDGGQTEYFIVDGLSVAERRYAANGTERYTMRYTFDENNSPIGFDISYPVSGNAVRTWQHYYFVKNLQGDVIALYHWYSAAYCTLVCTYEYDPWGKLLSVKLSDGAVVAPTTYHVSNYNPFRYRGYYYDNGTNLYYLQSRYYDPQIGRFLNADVFASTGQEVGSKERT